MGQIGQITTSFLYDALERVAADAVLVYDAGEISITTAFAYDAPPARIASAVAFVYGAAGAVRKDDRFVYAALGVAPVWTSPAGRRSVVSE